MAADGQPDHDGADMSMWELPPVRDEQGRLIFAGDPPVDPAEVPVQVVTTQDMYASGRTAISL